MDCDKYTLEFIDNYILNKLTEEEMDEFEKHILDCDFCFLNLKSQQEFHQAIKKVGDDGIFKEFQ